VTQHALGRAGPAGPDPAGPARPASSSPLRARLLWGVSVAAAAAGLFACYLRQSRIAAVNSDGASIMLQAWDMLHGNVLLHGWWVADVTFYTTELPEYMLAESVRGLGPDVVHVCAAVTYTLLVLLAALLARGRARGRDGVVRAVLAAGIMLAPGIGRGTYVLLTSPNHAGTTVPLLLTLLLLDRLPERWYVPVLTCVLLTWVQIADELAMVAGALPLALVTATRAVVEFRKRPETRWRYELSLAAAAVASVPLMRAAQAVIHAAGGYTQAPLVSRLLARPSEVLPHIHAVGETVLLLFGADFFGQGRPLLVALALLHLVGLVAAVAALVAGICFVTRIDRVSEVLAVGILATLAAGIFGTYVTSLSSAHEIAVLLPFGAALSGRLLGGRLARARRPWRYAFQALLAVGAACYLGALCYAATWAPSRAQNQALASWLLAHNLRDGLAGYWQANSTTLASGGQVRVAPLAPAGKAPYLWESQSSWFDPSLRYANFVVTAAPQYGPDSFAGGLDASTERGFFGKPSRTYRFGNYTILVWDKNLLIRLGSPAQAAGQAFPPARGTACPALATAPGRAGRCG